MAEQGQVFSKESKPIFVEVINKQDINTDFDLSKDTKFTIRALLTYCLFIISVYGFKLSFKACGFGFNIDNDTNMINLAYLSILLIVIHLIILMFYLWRDRLNLRQKEFDLKEKIINYKELIEQSKKRITNLDKEKNKRISLNVKRVGKSLGNSIDGNIEKETSELNSLINKLNHYKSINNNRRLILLGINIIYPSIVSVISIVLLLIAIIK